MNHVLAKNNFNGKSPEKRLKLLMSILALTIIGSTIGYRLLDPRESANVLDALYMTFITIATVGYKEVYPLGAAAKFFTIIVIAFSTVTLVYTIGTLGQLFIEGEIREILGRKKMNKKIKNIKEHYIIAGFGRVGQIVASEFDRMKIPYLVVESSESLHDELEGQATLYMEADASDDDALIEAGIQQAKGLVSTIPSEAESVFLTLTARQLNPSLFIIARADSKSAEKKLIRAGADRVVLTHETGGKRMALTAAKPTLVDCLTIDSFGGELGLGLEEIEIREGSDITGKKLMESQLRSEYNVSVVAIRKVDGTVKVNPSPEMVIDSGDILILVGEAEKLENLNLNPVE